MCALFLTAATVAYALFTAVGVFAEASCKGSPGRAIGSWPGSSSPGQRKLG